VRTFRLLSKEVIEWGNVSNLYVEVVHLDFLLERSHSVLFHDMPGKVLDGDNPVWYPRICGDFVLIMLVYYEKDLEEDYFLKLSTQSCCSLPMAALRTLVRSLVDFFSSDLIFLSRTFTTWISFLDISFYSHTRVIPLISASFGYGIPIP
jgi:hypothetical protein